MSINQLKYKQLATFITDETSSTSPGIIPSLKYVFRNYWGLVFSSIYLNILLNLQLKKAVNIIPYALLSILMFQSMYKAPLQILLIIDGNFIGFLCFLAGNIFIHNTSQKTMKLL